MIIYPKDINRSTLLEILSKGKCKVVFNKVDNTVRTMVCTLKPDFLPGKYESYPEKIQSSGENPEIIPVWDVEKGDWRSFKISKIIRASTIDETEEKNNSDKKKKNIKKTFEERVLEQKKKTEENRLQAKQIIDNLRKQAEERRLNNG